MGWIYGVMGETQITASRAKVTHTLQIHIYWPQLNKLSTDIMNDCDIAMLTKISNENHNFDHTYFVEFIIWVTLIDHSIN